VFARRLAVVRQELRVIGAKELPDFRIEASLDPAGPGRHAADYARLVARPRAACNSVSSEEILMNPSAASCGNVSPVP